VGLAKKEILPIPINKEVMKGQKLGRKREKATILQSSSSRPAASPSSRAEESETACHA